MSTSATQQVWRKAFTHTASVPLFLVRMKGASTAPSAFFSKPLAAGQERSEGQNCFRDTRTTWALLAVRHSEENELCLKSWQLSHWCKDMDSVCTWALELHGYWFWQFAGLGYSMRWVPNCAQIQVVRSPQYLAHDFPSPALPTGFSAELVHMAWCVGQMAWAAPSSKPILVILGTLPDVPRWCSTASEYLQESSQLFGRGIINIINLLNEFCRGSLSWPHWLFFLEGGGTWSWIAKHEMNAMP